MQRMLVYIVTPATQNTIDGRTKRWIIGDAMPQSGLKLIDRILAARGLEGEEARAKFDTTLQDLHDPELLPDADKASSRLINAIENDEPVVIYGDYDVDGITATAILYHTLKSIAKDTSDIRTYVPHRLEEGYGLNGEAIRSLAEQGAKVIISVDCGITATNEADIARQVGIDLIITDHHNPPTDGSIPDAFAVVHPRAPGSKYPFEELCGAGVAYKLAWRLLVLADGDENGKVGKEKRELLLELLAFASLGTIADLVPLVDENRVITKYGLGRVPRSSFGGLRELVSASGLDGEKIEADDVGFRLGPRLNACGRMGHAAEAVELFTTATGKRARDIAEGLHSQNESRRLAERRILEQAIKLAEAEGMTSPDKRAIVLAHEDWHPGVVGIVCSRLVDRFARPTILLCKQDDRYKGSGRSIPAFNLHAGLEATSDHLATFGGHDMAAGLSLTHDNLDAFVNAFVEHSNTVLAPDDLINNLRVDTSAATHELSAHAVRDIFQLRPFGMGNPRVRLMLPGVRIDRQPGTFGAKGNHLSLHLKHDGPALRCIMWNGGDLRNELARGQLVDVVVSPQISSYSGQVEPVIDDWRFAD
jgi:single-stranded-DNA-specific exonuclease